MNQEMERTSQMTLRRHVGPRFATARVQGPLCALTGARKAQELSFARSAFAIGATTGRSWPRFDHRFVFFYPPM